MQSTPQAEAFFLPTGLAAGDQRFCIFHRAHGGAPRGRVVYIHPFAEEMNKSRRMAALQSRALAAAGYSVLQIDLLGCGDSSGDFGDATWDAWIADVRLAVDWISGRDAEHGAAPLWLWGLRAGCLLATEAGQRLEEETVNYCFWQPVSTGKTLLQQFLRMKVAAEMMNGVGKGLMDELKQQLASGGSVEVAGYSVAGALAQGLESAVLNPPAGRLGRLEWLELTTREHSKLSSVSTQTLAKWSTAGFQCRSQLAQGPAFWQTAEIEDAPALLEATQVALHEREAVAA